MKKGRIIFAVLLALFIVVGIGLVSAITFAAECDCWGGCYYCDPIEDKCRTYDGPGACFCNDTEGCELNPRRFCCAAS